MSIHRALMLGSVLFVACGVPPVCDVRTCSGCCTSSGACVSGTSDGACGRGGASCNSCGSTQACVAGSCFGTGVGVGTGGSAGGQAGGRPASNGGGAAGGSSSSSAPACSTSDDCPTWFCECQSGPPVNSRRCVNNRCQDGAQACPGACAGFGTCWRGLSSGGFPGGSNAGPSTCGGASTGSGGGTAQTCSVTDLGKNCSAGTECQSGLCFGASPSFICTKACTSANDCPFDWVCESTSQGGRVCMSGREGASRSTANACRPVAHPDVGGPCVASCSGGHCVGNTCTHRCNSAAECPAGWTCSGTSFKSCRP
ncbi:MAG: hypothetical protein MUC96_20345 [Myxococcaceae bacterium]|nr:hypothetical protein [Myxococcaceae bacterium]